MVAPLLHYRRTLTGRIRARRTWLNKVLVQVEVKVESLSPVPYPDIIERKPISTWFEWRDATIEDMLDRVYGPEQNAAGKPTEGSA